MKNDECGKDDHDGKDMRAIQSIKSLILGDCVGGTNEKETHNFYISGLDDGVV